MTSFRFPFLFLLILLFTGLCIFWKYDAVESQLSLIIANTRESMAWYHGSSQEIKRYNEAIFMARTGDYPAAESLIAPLINNPWLLSPSDVNELYGDTLYFLGRSWDIIRVYYDRALLYGSGNLRIEKKLELLREVSAKNQNSWSWVTQTWVINPEPSQSWQIEKNSRLEELKKISEERWNYMNYNTSPDREQQLLIQTSLDILEWWKEKKDW